MQMFEFQGSKLNLHLELESEAKVMFTSLYFFTDLYSFTYVI